MPKGSLCATSWGTGRLPAVPHAAIVLRTAGGELLRSAQARGPASQPAGLLWHHSQGTLNVARRPIAWDWNW